MRILAAIPANPTWPLVWPQTLDAALGLRWGGRLDYMVMRGEPDGEPRDRVLVKYQEAREAALAGGYDALLTLEADIIPPADALQKLVDVDAPVAYGLYCWRHYRPYWNTYLHLTHLEGWSISEYPFLAGRCWGKVVEVAGLGSGCALIRREALERLPFWRPGKACQDWGLSLDCQRLGIRQMGHLGVVCGHLAPDYPARVVWPCLEWPFYRFDYLNGYRSKGMWKYIGGDKWAPGVPKRDLTDAEFNALWPDEREKAGQFFRYEGAEEPEAAENAEEPEPEQAPAEIPVIGQKTRRLRDGS